MQVGTRLGPYEILAPLGAGGMGEVYRAKDTRLDRIVAIKVLPEHLAKDAAALARFEREGKAVAALSHPNILAIHDVGNERGISFVVTELLEGETLRDRLNRSAIPWRKSVEFGIAIADGLAAAHAKGIIHRDLKPENIFITTAGHVKILDFGLARIEPERPVAPGHDDETTPTLTLATRPGTILGTLNYMSPEQLRGQHTDARSDIFSLGCVVFEMVAGRKPFTGDTPADTMTAILKEEPAGIAAARTDIHPELEQVIARCLEKTPEQRFQSAHDLAFALRSVLAYSSALSTKPRTPMAWPVRLAIVALAFGGLMVGAFMVRNRPRLVNREARATIKSLAVLPLENLSRDPEQEFFVDGMTEALISDLAKIGSLKVISRTSVMRYKATTKSLPEIARELNVDAVVEGSVLRVGDRVRITAQLIHASTDEHLWTESYDRDLRDILSLQSEVARTIAEQIKVTLSPQVQARLAEARPVNPDAYQAYLKGRFHWNKRTPDGLTKAVEYFEQAIQLDPAWPLGYAGLADAYALLPAYAPVRPDEAMPKAKAAAVKALQLDDSLAEAHTTLGSIAIYNDWDWTAVESEYKRAIALSPNYATAHQWYAEYLQYMGRHDPALNEMTKAHELDPLSLVIGTEVGWVHYCSGDLAEAESQYRKTLELNPDFAFAHRELAKTLLLQGRPDDALTAAREAARLAHNNPMFATVLGYVCARTGRPDEARSILDELTALSKESYVAPSHPALVHAGLDDRDRMFEWFTRACQERDVLLPLTLVDPLLAPMRTDPRFTDLLRRVGLPEIKRRPTPVATPTSKFSRGESP